MAATEDYIKERFPDGERRFLPEEPQFETRADSQESNVIEGYAAVFNSDSEDLGGFIERIAPGAFDDVLNDDTYALLNHNIDKILGRNKRNLTLKQDSKGLRYRVELPDTATANEARTLIKDKIIDKSSFAFSVKEQKWEYSEDRSKPHRRTILKVRRLMDVSPVAGPAYRDTSVAVRSMKPEVQPQQQEEESRSDANWLALIEYEQSTLI
jgi:HK97 family phage prohead protease